MISLRKALITISVACIITTQAVDLQCQYHMDDYDTVGTVYSCTVRVNLGITTADATVDRVIGSHFGSSNNDDVLGLTARDKGMQFMPRNLADEFRNLVALRVRLGRLREVHKRDFERWPKLRYLNMDLNDIEILEEDLFDGNAMLEVIWFEGNRIKSVDGGVFDSLSNLKDLDLNSNTCISSRVSNRYDVPSFLKTVKSQCFNSDQKVNGLKQKIEKLEAIVADLRAQIEKLEESLEMKVLENHQLSGMLERQKSDGAENLRLKGKIAELERDVEGKSEEIKVKLREIDEIKVNFESEVEKSMRLQEEIEKIEKIFKASQTDVKSLNDKVRNCSEQTAKLQEENSQLENKISDKNDQILSLNTDIFNLTEENSLNQQKISQITSKVRHLETENSALHLNLTHNIQALEKSSEIYKTHQNLAISLSQLTADNQKLTAELRAVARNYSKLQASNDVLALKLATVTHLSTSMSTINDTNESLREMNAMLESRVHESEMMKSIVLCIIVPLVVIVFVINALIVAKCRRGKLEVSCDYKQGHLKIGGINEDDMY